MILIFLIVNSYNKKLFLFIYYFLNFKVTAIVFQIISFDLINMKEKKFESIN